ncbi:Heat-stable 19 kDa antigen [Termitomyces sp. J132]|nr:Heat-stable 19 kDa antigen [Termitomyces sp. J132]
MKLTFVLFLVLLPILSLADTVTFDESYDNATAPIGSVACSNGINGLANFATLGSLPNFPNIGGSSAVASFGSPYLIDVAGDGFNIGLGAMNALTNNHAIGLGRIDATAIEVDRSLCGLFFCGM